MLMLASLVLGFATFDTLSGFVVVWLHLTPTRSCLDVTIWDALPWCLLLHAYLSPFLLCAMILLTMLVYATHWLSMHLYTLVYMFMHESWLLVCCPYFNKMKLRTLDLNLHLSLADTPFCLLSCLFTFCLFVSFLACLLASLFLCLTCLSRLSALCLFLHSLHFFLPLLICWFLVFAFTRTYMEWGRMELGHGFLSASKRVRVQACRYKLSGYV